MEVKIVAFEDKYAKSLSAMWSESSEGWNGSDMAPSIESIIADEKKAHVITNLAVLGDRVVGYCNLENDKIPGAYYIGLINVLPSLHGKKIGKKLLLKAIDKTIEDKIGRLDLYTWSGNTLAVPLYKKTGFLWRESPNGVHLVNFIPFLLTNDFFKPYFSKIDWYNDRVDEIIIKPDGREINNFYVYEYNWKNESEELSLVFEDNGKSICGFACNDFSLSLSIDNMKLPIGKDHLAKVVITSKLARNIPVKISGISNNYVNLTKETSFVLEGSQEIELPFTLNAIDENYSKLPNKPTVGCNIEIDGKVLPLGLGIEPTYPIDLKLEESNNLLLKGSERELLLFCKNNLQEDLEVEVNFAEIPAICQKNLVLKIGKDAQVKHTLPIIANQTYAGKYMIPITFKDSENRIEVPLNLNIQVLNDPKLAEFRSYITYVSKDSTFYLQKSSKFTHTFYNNNIVVSLSNPLISAKHINEFSESGPSQTKIDSNKNILIEEFTGKIYPNIVFVRRSYFDNSQAKVLWSLRNDGIEDYQEVEFSQGFNAYPYYQHCYNDGLYTHSEIQDASLLAENLTEPWILLKKIYHTTLLKFSGHDSLETIGWEWNLKKKVTNLKAGQEIDLVSIDYFFNLFYNYKSVRKFFYNKSNNLNEINVFNIDNKKGNPLYNIEIDKEFDFTVESNEIENGIITCNDTTINVSANEKAGKFKALDQVGFNKHELDFYINNTRFQESKYFIGYKVGEITYNEEKGVLTIDNSLIRFKSHIEKHPGIFSLEHQGKQVLNISYPQPKPQAWYNPWYGGICFSDSFNGSGRLMKEKSKQEYVELKDNFDNLWKGIKISTNYQKKDDWKDAYVLHQFYLTMPNTPVLASFAKIDISDKFLDSNQYFSFSLFTGAGDLTDYSSEALIADKYYKNHKCGSKLNHFRTQVGKISKKNDFSFITFSANRYSETTILSLDSLISIDMFYNLNRNDTSDDYVILPIQFVIFTDDLPKYEELSKINQISFQPR
ncbi:GNAT family N-acetyltransferase [bacterium]|nr:GNAT family N-acetyltransferase [bacterium]